MLIEYRKEHKEENIISNVFTYKLLNKTAKDINDISFKLKFKANVFLMKSFNISFICQIESILISRNF